MNLSWVQSRWNALAARERGLVGATAALILALLLWWFALAPALAVLRTSEAEQAALDAQLQQMLALQAQAQALQAQPKMSFDDALRAIDASVRQRLGSTGQMALAGERVSVTLKAVPAETLAEWLNQARINARAVPAEARLVRGPTPASPASSPGAAPAAATWDGTLVLSLPAH